MFTKTLFTLLIIATSFLGVSQKKSAHNIGSFAGVTDGFGLSYRYWPGKFGIQVTTAPMYFGKKNKFINIGFTGLYTIKDKNIVDLYGYVSNAIYISNNNSIYNIGGGLGTKIDFYENLNFNLQFGYGALILNSENQIYTIIGGAGLYYHF